MAVTLGDSETRFRRLFDLAERDILAYALRRVVRPEDAADILAETFLVAWRRIDDVPDGDAARLWLYGVARRQLANQRRGALRQAALSGRLRDALAGGPSPASEPAGDRVTAVRSALARLHEQDRELLTLSHWEELAPAEIAVVLGLSAVTLRSRLHRARRRLRAELARGEVAAAPTRPPTPILERTEC